MTNIVDFLVTELEETVSPLISASGEVDLSRLGDALGVNAEGDHSEEVGRWSGSLLRQLLDLHRQSQALNELADYLDFVQRVWTFISEVIASGGISDAALEVIQELVASLLNYRLQVWYPVLSRVLMLMTVLEDVGASIEGSYGNVAPFVLTRFDTAKISALARDPSRWLADEYGIGVAEESVWRERVTLRLLPRLSRVLQAIGIRARAISDSPILELAFPSLGAVLPSLRLQFSFRQSLPFVQFDGAIDWKISVGGWQLRLLSEAAAGSGGIGDFDISISVRRQSSDGFAIGVASGTRILVKDVTARAGVVRARGEVSTSVDLHVGNVTASARPQEIGGKFLDDCSGGNQVGGGGAFSIGWSSSRGFYGDVSGGGSARIGIHRSVGPVIIDAISGAFTFRDTSLSATLGVDFDGVIGPVFVGVAGVGMRARLEIAESDGSVDLSVDVAPPTGVSLGVKAGPVSGRGLISYERSVGRYSGALLLSIGDISLAALGVLDTRAPGVPDYSFLIVISARFTPVPLGFGFTLSGVGGLCGIQRAVSVEALQAGVRSGSLAPLLFPGDPAVGISQLVTGLQTVFPPTRDRYVFGPMFKLGWGTPTLVTADLGIILQLPAPIIIALIGQLSATFPKPEAAIVVLHIDILGVLDTGEKRLSIDASLRDSRVGPFALTGDMALRLHWGAESDFALSIGGFNPTFKPPPNFPTLRRLAISLGSGSNPRISLSAYFALTPNTLQVGARAEIYAEAAGFNILGYLEFHALFIFSPFHFRFDFAAGVALRRGSTVLAGVSVVGLIEGPRPWHVKGSASITILFFDISVDFETTFGAPSLEAPTETLDPWTLLEPALGDVRNWSAPLPEGRSRGVILAASDRDPAQLRLDPFSRLAVQQKELPLDQRITKLGERHVATPTRFVLGALRLGGSEAAGSGTVIETEALTGAFAAGQFQALTDAEKLSRPSFEPMQAGARVGGAMMASGVPASRPIQFRRTYARSPRTGEVAPLVNVTSQAMLAAQGFIQAPSLAAAGLDRFAPSPTSVPLVQMSPETYTLANADTLQVAAGFAPTASPSQASVALQALPSTRGQFLVVPSFESRS